MTWLCWPQRHSNWFAASHGRLTPIKTNDLVLAHALCSKLQITNWHVVIPSWCMPKTSRRGQQRPASSCIQNHELSVEAVTDSVPVFPAWPESLAEPDAAQRSCCYQDPAFAAPESSHFVSKRQEALRQASPVDMPSCHPLQRFCMRHIQASSSPHQSQSQPTIDARILGILGKFDPCQCFGMSGFRNFGEI